MLPTSASDKSSQSLTREAGLSRERVGGRVTQMWVNLTDLDNIHSVNQHSSVKKARALGPVSVRFGTY
jgi:hypothetical protein